MKVALLKKVLYGFDHYDTCEMSGYDLEEISSEYPNEEYYFVELEDFLKISKKMVGGVIVEEEQ